MHQFLSRQLFREIAERQNRLYIEFPLRTVLKQRHLRFLSLGSSLRESIIFLIGCLLQIPFLDDLFQCQLLKKRHLLYTLFIKSLCLFQVGEIDHLFIIAYCIISFIQCLHLLPILIPHYLTLILFYLLSLHSEKRDYRLYRRQLSRDIVRV
jgi:hypothetical protein